MTETYIAPVSAGDRPDPIALIPESQRRLSVGDYHRMIEAEILGPDDRVELLEGVIVEMTPQSPAHFRVIRLLTGILVRGCGPGFEVGVQGPLTVSGTSEPEPDLFVSAGQSSADEHPRTALLVVEVSVSSEKRDRVLKAYLYARAAIPEYWIVDVDRRELTVLRDPDCNAGNYRTSLVLGGDAAVSALKLPGVAFSVRALFPS